MVIITIKAYSESYLVKARKDSIQKLKFRSQWAGEHAPFEPFSSAILFAGSGKPSFYITLRLVLSFALDLEGGYICTNLIPCERVGILLSSSVFIAFQQECGLCRMLLFDHRKVWGYRHLRCIPGQAKPSMRGGCTANNAATNSRILAKHQKQRPIRISQPDRHLGSCLN